MGFREAVAELHLFFRQTPSQEQKANTTFPPLRPSTHVHKLASSWSETYIVILLSTHFSTNVVVSYLQPVVPRGNSTFRFSPFRYVRTVWENKCSKPLSQSYYLSPCLKCTILFLSSLLLCCLKRLKAMHFVTTVMLWHTLFSGRKRKSTGDESNIQRPDSLRNILLAVLYDASILKCNQLVFVVASTSP